MTVTESVLRAESVSDALARLAELGEHGRPLAGGTWVLRAGLRGEDDPYRYVAIGGIPELAEVSYGDGELGVGALVTHTRLAELVAGPPAAALVEAARGSAFPQVRNVATIGGNLAAIGFAEADLVPALLAGEAEVELAGPAGRRRMPVVDFLAWREKSAGELITTVFLPTPAGRRSGFARLTVRGSGEYPIANAAVSVDLDAEGAVRAARIAVGSVEPVAKLCPVASESLVGHGFSDLEAIEEAGRIAARECSARDGLDAPGWYRAEVLPTLVRRAAAHATGQEDSE
ncbi:FAD binding domain-containing protein [Amycolatopsis sacchari]|uniref:FAD binding domain-containing protein n=1 Tax=Amycolatopsis sacchari TaxID=115433 RepID=UPI003D75539B